MIIQPLSETRGGCRSVLALAADDTAKIDALKDHGELGRVDLCAGLSRWHERELRQEARLPRLAKKTRYPPRMSSPSCC